MTISSSCQTTWWRRRSSMVNCTPRPGRLAAHAHALPARHGLLPACTGLGLRGSFSLHRPSRSRTSASSWRGCGQVSLRRPDPQPAKRPRLPGGRRKFSITHTSVLSPPLVKAMRRPSGCTTSSRMFGAARSSFLGSPPCDGNDPQLGLRVVRDSAASRRARLALSGVHAIDGGHGSLRARAARLAPLHPLGARRPHLRSVLAHR